MSISNVVKNYIKEYYTVSYNPRIKQIVLHDEFEFSTKIKGQIDVGKVGRVKITLMWDKIEEVTGIQYQHKEYQSILSKLIFEIITNNKSKEFFKLLVEENIPVSLYMNEIIQEFPVLCD